MRILTDFVHMPTVWTVQEAADPPAEVKTQSLQGFLPMLKSLPGTDLIVLNGATQHAFALALLFKLWPPLKKPIILVDLILREPTTGYQRWIALLKRKLLQSIDHFILYFRDIQRYAAVYGIRPEKCSYVPFKSNIYARVNNAEPRNKPGYVLAAGYSLRDYDTFFKAMEQLDYPAAILQPDFRKLRRNGARFTWPLEQLPPNIQVLKDNGTQQAWIDNLLRARVVVVPTLRSSLCSTGISTYLDAMLLRKCVVVSEGPGVNDVLGDEAVRVPPESPDALAQAIQKVWTDTALYETTAEKGQAYAQSLGGETDFLIRILQEAVHWYRNHDETPFVQRPIRT
jgi:glycosyltransferase involved in cell wall biosynthesis